MYEKAITLLTKLNENGYKAYIVGGYPRDLYLNRDSFDIDVCTNATVKQIKELFNEAIPSINQYGSTTVYMNNIRFEITTFRRDFKYKDNRRPSKVEFTNNLLEDMKRRDFTINTLCLDSNGDIIDLLNAKQDLDKKIIRAVGNPKQKLKEDALRILRAIRFATVLNFELDESLKKSIKKNGYLLEKLSYHHKKQELNKIFLSDNIKYGLSLIKELELDKHLELSNISTVINTDLIGIWSQLDVLLKYSFTKVEKEQIKTINELLDKDILNNEILYKYGLYLCSIAGDIKNIPRNDIYNQVKTLQITDLSEIKIDGNKICDILNKKPGFYLKEIYKNIENKIVNNELLNDEKEILNYIVNNYS